MLLQAGVSWGSQLDGPVIRQLGQPSIDGQDDVVDLDPRFQAMAREGHGHWTTMQHLARDTGGQSGPVSRPPDHHALRSASGGECVQTLRGARRRDLAGPALDAAPDQPRPLRSSGRGP
jgi:hypothetical protein